MIYRVATTRQFDKDMERITKRGWDTALLRETIDLLIQGAPLPPKYRDHALKGTKNNFRECHVQPDWILMYLRDKDRLVLIMQRTGTHRDVLNRE